MMKIWSSLVLSITIAMTCLPSGALAHERYYDRSPGIHAGVGNLVRADVSGRGVHAGVGNLIRTDVSGRGIHAGVGNLIRVGVGGGRSNRYRDDDRYERCNHSHRHARYRNEDRYDEDRDYRSDDGYQGGGGLIGDVLGSVFGY